MENQKKKKITNYTILMGKKLGEGACGKVYVGEQDHTKLKVAVKVLEKKTVDRDYYLKSSLFSEIEILKTLKSPNIVGFLDVMESKHYYYIIQQFCDGGELRGQMKKKGKIPEKEAVQMLKQICNGFIELIKEGVMHRDLKPENILIHQGDMKLADFGFSKKDKAKRMTAQTMVGTPMYMSIQVLKGLPYSSKCDIWSLGLIFYEMLFGRTAWTGNSQYELIRNIETQPIRFLHQVSRPVKDFINRSLAKDQSKRFSWDQLLRHQIFQGYFVKKQQQNKQFQNRYKAIMNNIRQQVKENNIDLESNFQKLGVGKESLLSQQQFESLLKDIDHNITKQEMNFIFNKIVSTGSKTISYDQFQQALQKSGIPMSMIKKHKDSNNNKNDPFGTNGAGLFDLLVNQILTPGDQSMNAYMKNAITQQQPLGVINMANQMNQMNQQIHQINAIQQKQIGFVNSFNGLNGVNMGGLGRPGIGGMNQFGQMQFGAGFGNIGGIRNGWM